MKVIGVKSNTYINSSKEINDKNPKLLEYQNIKTFLQKAMFQIGLKKILWLKKLKTLWCEHILLVVLTENKFLHCFTKNICKNQIKNNLELKKVMKRKGDKRYVKSKVYDNLFNSWIDKKGMI